MPNPFVKLWKYFNAVGERQDRREGRPQDPDRAGDRGRAAAPPGAGQPGRGGARQPAAAGDAAEPASWVRSRSCRRRPARRWCWPTRPAPRATRRRPREYENAAQAFATQLVAAEQAMEDLKRSHDEALQAAEQARAAVEQSRMRLQTDAGRAHQADEPARAGARCRSTSPPRSAGQRALRAGQHAQPERGARQDRGAATPTRWARPSSPRPRSRAACSRCRRPRSTWPAPPGWSRSGPRSAAVARRHRRSRAARRPARSAPARRPSTGSSDRGPAGGRAGGAPRVVRGRRPALSRPSAAASGGPARRCGHSGRSATAPPGSAGTTR